MWCFSGPHPTVCNYVTTSTTTTGEVVRAVDTKNVNEWHWTWYSKPLPNTPLHHCVCWKGAIWKAGEVSHQVNSLVTQTICKQSSHIEINANMNLRFNVCIFLFPNKPPSNLNLRRESLVFRARRSFFYRHSGRLHCCVINREHFHS